MTIDLSRIDFNDLKKGSIIPAVTLEKAVGLSRNHKKYALQCMRVKATIQSHFERQKGYKVSVVSSNDDLCILTDSAASEYERKAFKSGLRYLESKHDFTLAVDVNQLTEEERIRHLRGIEVQGRYLQAIANERRKIRSEPARRSVPGIL